MRYKLEIRSSEKSRRIFLPMYSTYPRCFGKFEGIIDTGSPRTILSAKDAFTLSIPFKNLSSTDSVKGYGKGRIPALKINKFSVRVSSNDNKSKLLEFPIDVVDIPSLKKLDVNTQNRAFAMPTLLGIDFLEENKLSLFVDIKNTEAFLEDSEQKI